MKLIYKLAITALILGLLPSFLLAQKDTLTVQWSADNINPTINALSDAVANDTLTAADTAGTGLNVGDRVPNRVFKLLKGGYYWNTNRIDGSGFHLDIVGEPSDPSDNLYGNPPVIVRVKRDNYVDSKTIVSNASLTLKNLYLIGSDDTGDQTAYQPIELSGSGNRYVIQNCILEKTNFATIAWTGSGNTIILRDNVFRNLLGRPSTQQWEGRGISVWTDEDSVIMTNNTFFNLEFTSVQIEGGAPTYVLFNHNTVVNNGRQPFQVSWWREAYITNNLFYNTWYHGETPSDRTDPNREDGAFYTGNFFIADLPSSYGPEEGRRIAFTNNVAWTTSNITDWHADSLYTQPFAGTLSRTEKIDVYQQMVAQDTFWMDPGLNTTFAQEQYDNMIQNIEDLRAGKTPATDFMWMVAKHSDGTECYTCPVWPLPEDFSYTADLTDKSSDGLAIGDLKWYPQDKATYDANRAKYESDVSWIPGPKITLEPVAEQQAEDATLNGDAAIVEAQGETYYQMNAGFIQWDFNLDAAAQYDLNVLVDLNNRTTSGVNFFVNGNEIHDPRGWGQYVFGIDASSVHPNFPASGLDWWLIEQDSTIEFIRDGSKFLEMPAGANSIQIKASWCDNGFGGIDILEAGTSTVVKSLSAADVTSYQFATPEITNAPYVPLYFKSVHTNTGSITFNMDAASAGNFKLALFFQNPDAEKVANINVDGSPTTTVTLTSDPDSGAVSVLSPTFALTQGSHTFEVAVDNANIDYAQLIQETQVVNGLSNDDHPLRGFALRQNYPNPFNPTTNIKFDLGKTVKVKLTVYNILGQEVATLVNAHMAAGAHIIPFDASKLASGVYIYRLKAGDFVRQKKMMLLK